MSRRLERDRAPRFSLFLASSTANKKEQMAQRLTGEGIGGERAAVALDVLASEQPVQPAAPVSAWSASIPTIAGRERHALDALDGRVRGEEAGRVKYVVAAVLAEVALEIGRTVQQLLACKLPRKKRSGGALGR